MCRYCTKQEEIESDWLDITIEGDELRLYYDAYSSDSSFEEVLWVQYCPMCGKKLEPLEEEE